MLYATALRAGGRIGRHTGGEVVAVLFRVGIVIFTDTLLGTVFLMGSRCDHLPVVPIVTEGIYNRFGQLLRSLRIGKALFAVTAVPILHIAIFFTGGYFCLNMLHLRMLAGSLVQHHIMGAIVDRIAVFISDIITVFVLRPHKRRGEFRFSTAVIKQDQAAVKRPPIEISLIGCVIAQFRVLFKTDRLRKCSISILYIVDILSVNCNLSTQNRHISIVGGEYIAIL